jgi:hypothetical protein
MKRVINHEYGEKIYFDSSMSVKEIDLYKQTQYFSLETTTQGGKIVP